MAADRPENECSLIEMPDGSVVRVHHPTGRPPSPEAVEALAKLKSYLEAHPQGPAKGEDLEVDIEEDDGAPGDGVPDDG